MLESELLSLEEPPAERGQRANGEAEAESCRQSAFQFSDTRSQRAVGSKRFPAAQETSGFKNTFETL